MNTVRKVTTHAAASLLLLATTASSAWSVTAYNQATGVNLSVGESVSGTTATGSPSQLTLGTDVISCHSTIGGTVQANPNASGHVVMAVNSLTWSNCTDNTGGSCSLTSESLPWTTTADSGNGGGIVATSTTGIDFGTGTTGDFSMGSGCASILIGCQFQGATAGPSDGLDNYVTGAWDNATATLTLNAVAVKSPNCSTLTGTWTAAYKMTLPGTSNTLMGLR